MATSPSYVTACDARSASSAQV